MASLQETINLNLQETINLNLEKQIGKNTSYHGVGLIKFVFFFHSIASVMKDNIPDKETLDKLWDTMEKTKQLNEDKLDPFCSHFQLSETQFDEICNELKSVLKTLTNKDYGFDCTGKLHQGGIWLSCE